MSIADRRYRTECKIKHRENLIKQFGLRKGRVYKKHREKIDKSLGFIRDGNLTHYVQFGFRRRTKNSAKHRYYGPKYNYSHHDNLQLRKSEYYEK